MFNPSPSFLFRFCRELSPNLRIHLAIVIVFETLSSLQTISTVVEAAFPSAIGSSWNLFSLPRKLALIPSVFSNWALPHLSDFFQLLWTILIVYISVFTIAMLVLIWLVYKQKSISFFSKFISFLSIFHSRVLYYPISLLFVQIIKLDQESKVSSDPFLSSESVLKLSVFFLALNFLLAFSKELLLYKISKNKSAYAAKNNTQPQLLFLNKTINLLITFLSSKPTVQSWFSGSLTICIAVIILSIHETKLPFYNVTFTKYSYFLTSTNISLTLFALVNVNITNTKTVQSICFIGSAFLVRFLYFRLTRLFEEILSGKFKSPELAIHFPILLKRYSKSYDNLITARKAFPLTSIYFYSFFSPQFQKDANLTNLKISEFMNFQFYENFVKHCYNRKIPYKKSPVFLLYMVKLMAKKSQNPLQALSLLEDLRGLTSWIPTEVSISSLFAMISKLFVRAEAGGNLEVGTYFRDREQLAMLRKEMRNEVECHLEFWKELTQKGNVNMKNVIDISDKIQRMHRRIRRTWKTYEHEFQKTDITSLAMYGLYLDLLRGMPQESSQVMKRYRSWKANLLHDVGQIMTDSSVLIVISLSKSKIGNIVDVSDSVRTLFQIKKEKLIGTKMNQLMPDFIGRVHDRFIQRFTNASSHQNKTHQVVSYGKTATGDLIKVDIQIKIYPYLDKELSFMGLIKQIAPIRQVLIVNSDGVVVEASEKLRKIFNIQDLKSRKMNISQICPQFGRVNNAFNFSFAPKDMQTRDFRNTVFSEENILDPSSPASSRFTKTPVLHPANPYETEVNIPEEESPFMLLSHSSHRSTMKVGSRRSSVKSPLIPFLNSGQNIKLSGFASPKAAMQVASSDHSFLGEDDFVTLCQKFQSGDFLKFMPYQTNARQKNEGANVEIIVEPYIFEGHVYKILKFVSVKRLRNHTKDRTPNWHDKTISALNSNHNQTTERSRSSSGDDIEEAHVESKNAFLANLEVALQGSKDQTDSNDALFVKDEAKEFHIEQSIASKASSLKSQSNANLKLIKQLTDLLEVKQIRSVTKVSIAGVYAAILLIIALVFVNYSMTQVSLNQNDSGVSLLNVLSQRLSTTIIAWEWLLMFYTRLLGLRPLFSVYGFSRQVVYNTTRLTEKYNSDFMTKLDNYSNIDIFLPALENKGVNIYDAHGNPVSGAQDIGLFQATNMMLLPKYFIGKYKGLDSVLVKRPEFITISNNTANTYLVACENQVKEVFDIIQSANSRNIEHSLVILIIENLALLSLCFAIALVGKVIFGSYKMLFKGLVQIQKSSIEERLQQIQILDNFLRGLGSASGKSLDSYFVETKQHKEEAKPTARKKKEEITRLEIAKGDLIRFIVKFNLPSILLILIISGAFLFLYIQSVTSFNSLNKMVNQLYVLNRIGYENAFVVANFYFSVIYQNRTDMLIRNEPPLIQLDKNLANYHKINNMLMDAFGETTEESDKVVADIFQKDVCSYVNQTYATHCSIVSQNGSLGLLGINSYAGTVADYYINKYLANQTVANARTILVPYYNIGVSFDFVLNDIYNYLINHTHTQLNERVAGLTRENTLISWGAIILILLSTITIQAISIRKYVNLDHSQKKIWCILTFRVLGQNKILGYLLKKQFNYETNGLGKIMQQ